MGEKPLFIHVYIKERVMINETTKFRNLVISAMSELGEFESDTEWKMVEEYSGDEADRKNSQLEEGNSISLVEQDNFKEGMSKFMDWAESLKAHGYSLYLL